MKIRYVAWLVAGVPLLGCAESLLCVGLSAPAFTVEVRFAITKQPAAWPTLGIAVDGAFVDTLDLQMVSTDSTDALTLWGPQNRTGVYTVRLQRAGYHDWVATAVRVETVQRGCPLIAFQRNTDCDCARRGRVQTAKMRERLSASRPQLMDDSVRRQ